MGQNELSLSYRAWSKRIAQYQAQGLPQSVYLPIAQHDMTKTAQTGSAPMTDLEAAIAVQAAAGGHPAIQEAPRHSGGILGAIETVASNIVPDVGNIITGLPRGVYDIAKDVVSPAQWSKTAKDVGQAASDISDPGKAVRDLAQSPILSLIPGVSDAAQATTAQGRTALEEHPVSSLLDLGGVTGRLGEVAGKGALARSGELDALAERGVDTSDPKAVRQALKDSRTPAAALARGHVVQAGARALDQSLGATIAAKVAPETATRAAEEDLGPGQRVAKKVAQKAHLDAANKTLSTAMARMSGKVALEGYRTDRALRKLIGKDLLRDPEKLAAFHQKLTEHSQDEWPAIMDPHELAVAHTLRDETRPQLEARYGDQVTRTPEGIFPVKAQAAVHYRRMAKAGEIVAERQRIVDGAQRSLERIKAEQESMPVEAPLPRTAAQGMQYAPGTPASRAAIERSDKVTRATLRLHRAEQRLARTKAEQVRHRDNYMRALHTTDIPANLHPMLAEALRSHTEKVLEGRRAGVLADVSMDRIAQAKQLSEIETQMKSVRNTGQEEVLRGYLGKEEYERVKTDAIDFLLELNRQGKAPLYFHSVHANGEYHALSTKIKALDTTEAQLLKHSFNLTHTLQTPFVGLLAEDINIGARQGTRQVIDQALRPFDKTHGEIKATYQRAAQRRIAAGKVKYTTVDQEAMALQRREWTRWNPETGAEIPGDAHIRDSDHWIRKDLYDNFRSFTKGGNIENHLTDSKIYQRSMKIFRTSVLYGPRHFVHVVVGGAMPVMMAHPTAWRELPKVWPAMKAMLKGELPEASMIPDELMRPFDWKTEEGLQREIDARTGRKMGTLLRKYLEHTGNLTDGLARVEDTAQMMYQAITYLSEIRHGRDPMEALESARRTVVNMDTASPFERTIMKQVMPFYSFSRFATLFLLQLPFDHPVRVSMLSSMSNQAIEEWGTGLPMNLMDLLFIGPEHGGNQMTVNLKNINPFRSIANTFTIGGFFSGLNPAIQAMGSMMGINTLSGSSEMYPEISYNPQTGDLETDRPKGDMWTAIESFVPEVGALDSYLNRSGNMRYLYQNDRQAWMRQIWSEFNLPFTPSEYNLPSVRGKVGLNLYKGAEKAAAEAKRTGDFSGEVSRYNLVPANLTGRKTMLYTPAQLQAYWRNLEAEYAQRYPGVNPAALIAKS